MAGQSEKITIVIPTFNRTPYLRRLLLFFGACGLQSPIIILDSGSSADTAVMVKEFAHRLRISYQAFPGDVFIVRKIAEGLQMVQTEYAVLCADDDFLIPDGMERAVDFLEKHPDYVMAQGFFFLHYVREQAGRRDVSFAPLYIGQRSIEQQNVEDRLEFFLSGRNVGALFFAVSRTKILREAWQEAAQNVKDWGLSETIPSALCLIYGKMKVLPDFFCTREPNTYQWYDKEYLMKMYAPEKCDLAERTLRQAWDKVAGVASPERNKILSKLWADHVVRQLNKPQKKQGYGAHILRQKMFAVIYRLRALLFSRRALMRLKQILINEPLDAELIRATRMTYQRKDA